MRVDRAPAPWARACALSGCSALLGGAAHVAGGGRVPPLVLAALALVLVPVVRSFLDREASAAAVLALVAGIQPVLHLALGWSGTAGSPDPAGTLDMAGHLGMVAGVPSAGPALPSPLMLLAHTVAVLLVVAVLRHAEAALCAAARRARTGTDRLRTLVDLATALPALPRPRPPVAPTTARTPGPQVLLQDGLHRRGPPVPVS